MSGCLDDVIKALETRGPLTGKDLLRLTRMDEFALWSVCNRSERIITRITGRRYLRLDRQVAEYARISPSIMREFHGYTVVGLKKHLPELTRKAELMEKEIAGISAEKFALAQNTVAGLVESLHDRLLIKERACFMIAGDVVYGMAHAEPRPERSTGELVRGSDIDLVIVVEDMPAPVMEILESSIYDEKYSLLVNPSRREELDYIVKDISRVRKQLQFDGFKEMVASKILHEARFLYGSRVVYDGIKRMLAERGVPDKLRALEEKALLDRRNAEAYLLEKGASVPKGEWMKLFYTAEEKEEIF